MYYSYSNNPAYGNPSCEGCCGATISGNLYSEPYSQSCFDLLKPKAKIIAGSGIDNLGSVGGVEFLYIPIEGEAGGVSILQNDTIVTPSIDVQSRRIYVPFFAANDESCGPYGLIIVTIKWFFE
jgi:hypothetical protein